MPQHFSRNVPRTPPRPRRRFRGNALRPTSVGRQHLLDPEPNTAQFVGADEHTDAKRAWTGNLERGKDQERIDELHAIRRQTVAARLQGFPQVREDTGLDSALRQHCIIAQDSQDHLRIWPDASSTTPMAAQNFGSTAGNFETSIEPAYAPT